MKTSIINAIKVGNARPMDIISYIGGNVDYKEFCEVLDNLQYDGKIVYKSGYGYKIDVTDDALGSVIIDRARSLNIDTLDQFADYINSNNYKRAVADCIIAINNWTDLWEDCDLPVCCDYNGDCIVINCNNGMAEVKNNYMKSIKKRKVTLTDSYSDRALNIVVELTDGEINDYMRDTDRDIIFGKLSANQKKRIEGYFGKMNAYYTKIEIL